MIAQVANSTGSGFWQAILLSAAVVLVLLEVLRGWRLGPLRQATRLVALLASYSIAIFGGRAIAPLLRPLLKMPDIVLQTISGAVLALITYSVITSIGTILFKKTDQQQSGAVRLLFGVSGAVMGVGFGLFVVWLLFTGVRLVGAMADAGLNLQSVSAAESAPVRARRNAVQSSPTLAGASADATSLIGTLANMKTSLDKGVLSNAVHATDPLPAQTFGTLAKLSRVLAQPHAAERFFQFQGAREISEHPKITALRNDPQIARLISEGRFLELLQNQRLIDAMNDKSLADRIKKFDLERALDYALESK